MRGHPRLPSSLLASLDYRVINTLTQKKKKKKAEFGEFLAVEAGELLQVTGQPRLHTDVQASLGYRGRQPHAHHGTKRKKNFFF